MDFEPMDVDKSASSTSKMDISFNDTASDIYVLDDDDDGPSGSNTTNTAMKVIPQVNKNTDDIFIAPVKIKKEKPDDRTLPDIINKDDFFDSQQEVQTTAASTNARPKSSIKTYHIKMHQKQKREPPPKLKFLVFGVLVLVISIISYQVVNFKCAEEIDLRSLRKSYTENLFGQSAAANKIIETLNMKDRSKIMFFYGGTGVGKTYAASFILDKIWNSGNVYHYTMPTFAETFSPELMFGLTVCKTSLLVVDDLSRNDLHITAHIKNVIAKSEKLGKNITIILIYNCDNITENFVKKCDDSFQIELEQNFGDINVEKYFVKFHPLGQDHLKKCVEKELGSRKVSGQDLNNILKNFDVSLDGCKGVYTKIKFMNVI